MYYSSITVNAEGIGGLLNRLKIYTTVYVSIGEEIGLVDFDP